MYQISVLRSRSHNGGHIDFYGAGTVTLFGTGSDFDVQPRKILKMQFLIFLTAFNFC
jgi:hypothetical protein